MSERAQAFPGGRAEGLARLRAAKVVPVVRTASAHAAEQAVQWLHDGGLRTFEITLTTPDALSLIRALAADQTLLVGAGTVFGRQAAREVIEAGARFVVSPIGAGGLPGLCAEYGVPCVLGALSPTEVANVLDIGADAVKIFPVSAVGGAGYIRALSDVFPAAVLAPTGGISVSDIGAFLEAGSAFVGVGGQLVDRQAIARGDGGAIRAAAEQALAAAGAAASP